MGFSALKTGVAFLPVALVIGIVVAGIVAQLLPRVGPEAAASSLGTILLTVALFWSTRRSTPTRPTWASCCPAC